MFANAIVAAALTYTSLVGAPAEQAPITVADAQPGCWIEHKTDLPDELLCDQGAPYAYAENDTAGAGGWVLTQEGIGHDHECVIHLSLQPYRAIVVADSDPLCEAEAVQVTADVGQTDEEADGGLGNGFGGSDLPGQAVCGTDAQCAAWSHAHGEEPTGYAAGK